MVYCVVAECETECVFAKSPTFIGMSTPLVPSSLTPGLSSGVGGTMQGGTYEYDDRCRR